MVYSFWLRFMQYILYIFGVALCNPDWKESQNFSSVACFCPIVTLREFVTQNQAAKCYSEVPEIGMPLENRL